MHGQTLEALHDRAHIAHLDISSNNIMLRKTSSQAWDAIRLLDLGLAQKCVTGVYCSWYRPGSLIHDCISVIDDMHEV